MGAPIVNVNDACATNFASFHKDFIEIENKILNNVLRITYFLFLFNPKVVICPKNDIAPVSPVRRGPAASTYRYDMRKHCLGTISHIIIIVITIQYYIINAVFARF